MVVLSFMAMEDHYHFQAGDPSQVVPSLRFHASRLSHKTTGQGQAALPGQTGLWGRAQVDRWI